MTEFSRRGTAAILAATMLASTSPAISAEYNAQKFNDEIGPKLDAFRQCITLQAVKLGENNSEPAETILRAVAAVCKPAEDDLRALFALTPFPPSYVDRRINEVRKPSEDAGIAALLQKRSELRASR